MRSVGSVHGKWFRWSRYRLLDGIVAPAPESEPVRFDPWRAWEANLGKYRTVQQPYLSLLELQRSLKEEERATGTRPSQLQGRGPEGPVVGPPNSADERILDWCSRHGHVGIFSVMCNLVQLTDSRAPDAGITRTQYVREGDEWHVERTRQFAWFSTPQETEEHLRSRVKEPSGTFNWFNFGSRAHDQRPIEDLGDYFPQTSDAHDSFVPPLPLSEEFWQSYGEPLWEISRFCDLFARAVDYLKEWNDEAGSDEQQSNARRASLFLKDLARNVEIDDVDNTRRSAGLLASHALMFLWDRADGRRCLQCVRCQDYFVSNDRKARYCSPQCRNIVQSRRHREKRAIPNSGAEVS